MALETDDGRSGCVFLWKIENIRHCWVKHNGYIESPIFIADGLDGTKWFLRLYPSGINGCKDKVCFYLHSAADCVYPHLVGVYCQVAILDKDGSVLKEMTSTKRNFNKNNVHLFNYVEIKMVFVTQREVFLPEDTLTVQCAIWNTEAKPVKPQQLYALTVFRVERRNFIWRIDEFSYLKSGLKNKIKEGLIDFDLVFNEGLDFENKLVLTINSFNGSLKYFSIKVSIVNSNGKEENWGTHEYFAENLKIGMTGTLLFTKQLMENCSRYLPNDVLTLNFQYTYSDGTVSYEQCGCGVIAPTLKNEVVESGNKHNIGKEKSETIPVLVKDLKSVYIDKILCDTELRTSTQTFPAHKVILSARSPVFRKMFTNDMKEKISGHADITDLEDDTVHRMLVYIYTDSLEGMQFDSARKLYVAADKYEILSLRSSCGSFLKANLSPSNACDILALADQHQDDDLKSAVQDFILQHDKEVFGSVDWKHFMAANIHLAADIMYQFTQCKINEP